MGYDSLRIRRAEAHNEVMVRNEALLARIGALSPCHRLQPTSTAAVEVGDTLALYAEYGRTCSPEARQVNAVVRLVGSHTTWLDDLDNPSGTFADSELADLDAFYAANISGVLDDYFGRLSDVDGNDRVLILMTKEVNRRRRLGRSMFGVQTSPLAVDAQLATMPRSSTERYLIRTALLAPRRTKQEDVLD